jgi:hypothetical protein
LSLLKIELLAFTVSDISILKGKTVELQLVEKEDSSQSYSTVEEGFLLATNVPTMARIIAATTVATPGYR